MYLEQKLQIQNFTILYQKTELLNIFKFTYAVLYINIVKFHLNYEHTSYEEL